MNPDPREEELLARVRRGDREAFAELVEPYQGRVYAAVKRLVGNPEDAAELAQEAILRAFWKVTGFHGRSHFYTWLYRIAMNLAYRRLVQRRRESLEGAGVLSAGAGEEGPPPQPQVPSAAPSPRQEVADREQQALVRQALSQLKPDDFQILVLREFEELSYEQIARRLQIPEGTVMSRLHRARLALAEQLAQMGLGPSA